MHGEYLLSLLLFYFPCCEKYRYGIAKSAIDYHYNKCHKEK